MANEPKLPGWQWVLFLKRSTDTDFSPVACLETCEMDDTTNEIDTTSKCDNGAASSMAGVKSYKLTGSGFSIDDRGLSLKSFTQLFQISTAKELITIRWATQSTPGATDFYYEGQARITSLKQTAAVKDSVKFDVEFSVQGFLNLSGSY